MCCCLIFFSSASSLFEGQITKLWYFDRDSLSLSNEHTCMHTHTAQLCLCWRCDDAINSNKQNKMGKYQTNRKTDHHKPQRKKAKHNKEQRSNNVISTFNNGFLGIGFHFVVLNLAGFQHSNFGRNSVIFMIHSHRMQETYMHITGQKSEQQARNIFYNLHRNPQMLNCMNSQADPLVASSTWIRWIDLKTNVHT